MNVSIFSVVLLLFYNKVLCSQSWFIL